MNTLQGRNVKPRSECPDDLLLDRPPHFDKYGGYSLTTWLTEEGAASRRRAVPMQNCSTTGTSPLAEDQTYKLRRGELGWRHHWRHGMIGAVQYWAGGSRDNVVRMLVGLAEEFKVADAVVGALMNAQPSGVSMNAQRAIAENVKAAVAGLKPMLGTCHEPQRREYHIVLAAAFGAPAKVGDPRGMALSIGNYLNVPVGSRCKRKSDGTVVNRDYASRQAQILRAGFDRLVSERLKECQRTPEAGEYVLSQGVQVQFIKFLEGGGYVVRSPDTGLLVEESDSSHLQMLPNFAVGDEVLSHGLPAVISDLLPNGGCKLTFTVGDEYQVHTYRWRYGKVEGSARLTRPPALLIPPPRATSSLSINAATRRLVREHAQEVCPLSPCKRDAVRRHVGPHVWATRQALILHFPLHTLCALFMEAHPGLLKESQYRIVVKEEVWELKHQYRQTCLCRSCFNYRCYKEALIVVHGILAVIQSSLVSEQEPDESDLPANMEVEHASASTAPEKGNATIMELVSLCEKVPTHSTAAMSSLLCSGCFKTAAATCVRGDCERCGFAKLWSSGVRKEILDADGNLRANSSQIWRQELQWHRIRTGGDGSNSEDDLRQTREGSVVKFLDEFEEVQKHQVRHSFHIQHAKAAESDFARNSIPGMLDEKSDWSENGSLEKRDQLQSEYWTISYYSLLISITSFLVASVWKDRSSVLSIGTHVTVEPLGSTAPDETSGTVCEHVDGSFWAEVVENVDGRPYEAGEHVQYVVRGIDGSTLTVQRSQLRHRKRYRIAFIQITNDKKHDFYSSTAFASRRLQFFQKWNDSGRTEALDWASDDFAERERKRALTEMQGDVVGSSSASHGDAQHTEQPETEEAHAAQVQAQQAMEIAARTRVRSSQPTSVLPRPRMPGRRSMSVEEFNAWLEKLDKEKFWAWIEDSDNATHFKSKESLYFWSKCLDEVEFVRALWVEFGCPGHGKGPWDGLGAMVKTKVTRDLTNEQVLTPSGDMNNGLEVAQHARATFCTQV